MIASIVYNGIIKEGKKSPSTKGDLPMTIMEMSKYYKELKGWPPVLLNDKCEIADINDVDGEILPGTKIFGTIGFVRIRTEDGLFTVLDGNDWEEWSDDMYEDLLEYQSSSAGIDGSLLPRWY